MPNATHCGHAPCALTALALLFAACQSKEAAKAGSAGGPPAVATAASNVPAVPGPSEPTPARMGAPLLLRLRGPDPAPSKGEIDLDVELAASEAMASPVSLTTTLPSGVTLLEGKAAESITIAQPGKTTRKLKLSLSAPLASPIVVVAETQGPDGGFGLRAERRYPASLDPAPGPGVRPPPGGRPPAP
jgi:hypothetical protein